MQKKEKKKKKEKQILGWIENRQLWEKLQLFTKFALHRSG